MATPDLAYFQSIPWCSDLLNNPDYVITPTTSREPKASTEDALFSETLQTDRTISACLSLYKRLQTSDAQIEEVKTLLALGSGVNGYPHICHGGIIATMIDEVMGILLSVNNILDEGEEPARVDGRKPLTGGMATVTAELSVKYLRPLKTPQTVCVTARFAKMEGRKIWINGVIEDSEGVVVASGVAVFVRIRREKL